MYRPRKPTEVLCVICGNSFDTTSRKAKYCLDCKAEINRTKAREFARWKKENGEYNTESKEFLMPCDPWDTGQLPDEVTKNQPAW